MKFNKFDIAASINELQAMALDNPITHKKYLLTEDSIKKRSVIRPSVINNDKIVVGTLIWYVPAAKGRFSSALLFSLSDVARILPKHKIQYTGFVPTDKREIDIWLPLVFGGIYDSNKLLSANAIDITETNYNALFYIAYLDENQDILIPHKGKRIL